MRSFLKKINALIRHISGAGESFPLEHQCFNSICYFLAWLFFVSTGVNLGIGLDPVMTWGTLVSAGLFYLFYRLSRYKKKFYQMCWIVLFFGCVLVNLSWFFTGGISGTATIISLNIIAVVNLILSGRQRVAAILLVCANLAVLYAIEYTRPFTVHPSQSRISLYIDLYFTFIVATVLISFVIHFTMAHFRSERTKVTDREQKLKALVDNLPDSVWLKDDTGRFTMVNRPFSENCGVPIDRIIGRTVFDVWPEDKAVRFQNDDRQIMISGNKLDREEILFGSNGREKRFEIIKTPIIEKEGRVKGIVGIARDITARYEDEDRLKKYKRIVDTSIDQMALINANLEYEAANQSYLQAHGLRADDLSGKAVSDIHPPDVFKYKIMPHLKKAFNGDLVNYQDENEYPDKGKRYEEVSYFPHKNEEGLTISVVIHIKDVTEKTRMVQRLGRSEKMEAIGTLAGGIAHDFNNILSGILGYAQLGKLNISEAGKVNRHLDQIIKGSQRAGELIRQILTFSRQYEYEKQPLQTSLIVKEVLKLIRASIPSYIDMDEHIDSTSFILADPSQIHQIVMNLCTNAYHAITGTKGSLTISLSDIVLEKPMIAGTNMTINPGRYQHLSVADTGSGIEAQNLEKIFDPYFTTKEMDKGTGLGLALVHGIIEELKGWIKVDSQLGKGSVFHIYFPLMREDSIQENTFDDTAIRLRKGSGHIMVVDDETSILFSTRELLEDCGYTVSAFVNGELALEAFVKSPDRFDLVLTDMTMPKMTGDILAKSILQIRPDMPVILCTGYSDRITEAGAHEIGICEYVQKPMVSSDLTEMIGRILQRTDK